MVFHHETKALKTRLVEGREKAEEVQGMRMGTESRISFRAEHGEVELGKWDPAMPVFQAGLGHLLEWMLELPVCGFAAAAAGFCLGSRMECVRQASVPEGFLFLFWKRFLIR